MSSIHDKEYRKLIKRLIKARKEAGLTQKEVARKLDQPQSFISKVETCQRRLDVIELKRFASLYGVNLDSLLY
ncbi:helix-turn-helix transcriptional regulator [Candidatus Peregrinibacteria bacterium]|jgi:transcriptional regulator with XRE-family HTH domain|nr:helix-turn-helix transcriptional regulator [Candidatus Peregrinibacteria bacterium]MBT7484626.1 helix-turn-helix transcriptional regulator [Candidatus Peregrinibacteria bacterium]MBT7702838.1 helix-turn-helix transcriptional regulator [Candidatus Peregrinibacteria bacterium]